MRLRLRHATAIDVAPVCGAGVRLPARVRYCGGNGRPARFVTDAEKAVAEPIGSVALVVWSSNLVTVVPTEEG